MFAASTGAEITAPRASTIPESHRACRLLHKWRRWAHPSTAPCMADRSMIFTRAPLPVLGKRDADEPADRRVIGCVVGHVRRERRGIKRRSTVQQVLHR